MSMILTVQDDYDKEKGTTLPMFSRAGKSTVSQYLVFNNAPGNRKEFDIRRGGTTEEDDDFELMMGGDKKIDLHKEMAAIQETTKKHGSQSTGPRSRVRMHEGMDMLKDKRFRSRITSSFNATSRDAWQEAHASKTRPPDVGKYKPKYNSVWAPIKDTIMRPTPPNEGKKRIDRKQM